MSHSNLVFTFNWNLVWSLRESVLFILKLYYSTWTIWIWLPLPPSKLGVIFVHDLSQRNTKSNLQKWASEIALNGSFSAPLGSYGPCGLPIPYLVIGNKVDIAEKQRTTGSSGNLVDAARLWVEKQGLLSTSEELPVTDSFPANTGLISVNYHFQLSMIITYYV